MRCENAVRRLHIDIHRVSGLEADQDDQLVMVVGYVTDVAAYSCVLLHLTAVTRLLEFWYNDTVNRNKGERQNMEKHIKVIGREYAYSSRTKGPAPYPKFDKMCINESKIEYDERFKECHCWIGEDGVGNVEWLTQDSEFPSELFNKEIVRAFKANGLKSGSLIEVAYGIRDRGLTEFYTLTV